MLPLVTIEGGVPTTAPDALRDRVVLVAGATGGLGRATSLAAAAAGATVVLLGRKVRALEAVYDEIERLGAPQPAVYPMDLAGATPRDYVDLSDSIEREFGRSLDQLFPGVVENFIKHELLEEIRGEKDEPRLRLTVRGQAEQDGGKDRN